jgi:hypothetical protein
VRRRALGEGRISRTMPQRLTSLARDRKGGAAMSAIAAYSTRASVCGIWLPLMYPLLVAQRLPSPKMARRLRPLSR